MVPNFFEILGNLRVRIFFFQLFDHSIDEHRSRFLLEVTHLAREFARKRKRLPIHNCKFLPELIVLTLQILSSDALELALLHHLGDFFDGHHLPFEHRKNLRQRHRPHLHASQSELFTRDASREIVHQFLLANGEPLDNPSLLALERFAFENLRNAPAKKIDSRFHFFLECIRLPARKSEQPRPVRIFEVIHIAAVGSSLGLKMHLFDHAHNHPAAAGPGKPAHEKVVARCFQLDAHAQRAHRPVLSHVVDGRFHLRGRLERDASGIAMPAKFFGRQAARRVLSWSFYSLRIPKRATLARHAFHSHSLRASGF